MAESSISGDVGGGIQLTCILEEGNVTVSDVAMNSSGFKERTFSLATPIAKNMPVCLYDSTEATYDATLGMPMMKTIVSGGKGIGRVVSEPRWQKLPSVSADADSLTKRLTGQFYRVATVELWGGITSIFDVKCVTVDAAAIVPGAVGTISIDASLSIAAGKIVCTDVASGGTGIFPFHYQAKAAAATVTLLVGIVDTVTVAA